MPKPGELWTSDKSLELFNVADIEINFTIPGIAFLILGPAVGNTALHYSNYYQVLYQEKIWEVHYDATVMRLWTGK